MHNFFRVYWMSLYMFRTVSPSIIRSSRLYIQHQVHSYVIQVRWLLASGHEMELLVQTVVGNSPYYVFWHCGFLPFILIDIYLGASCFSLQILLYHIAALVLNSFSLMFLYWYVSFACLALANLTFMGPCIVIYFYSKTK